MRRPFPSSKPPPKVVPPQHLRDQICPICRVLVPNLKTHIDAVQDAEHIALDVHES